MVSISRVKSLIARALSASEQRVVRQSFWLYAALATEMLGGLATVSLTARILGVEGLGHLAVIVALSGLVYGFAAMPGGNVITTFVTRAVAAGRSGEAAQVFRFALAASMGLALIAYVVIAVLVFTASGLLEIESAHKNAILLYSVGGLFTSIVGESQAALRLADRMQFYLLVTAATRGAGVGLLAVVWLAGGGLTEVVLTNIATAAMRGLGMLAAVVVAAPLAGLAGFLRSASLKVPPDVTRYYTGAFWELKLITLVDNIDIILLARFTGAADVGLYRGARQIVEMTRRSIGLIPNMAQPEYSQQWYAGQGTELRRSVFRFTALSMTLAAGGLGLLTVFREPIIRLCLGGEFSGAAPLLLILVLGALPVAAAFRMLPSATGRAWPPLLSRIAGLAVFLAAMAWLVSEYGATGVAWARTMFSLVSFLVIVPFSVSILRQSDQLRGPQHPGKTA